MKNLYLFLLIWAFVEAAPLRKRSRQSIPDQIDNFVLPTSSNKVSKRNLHSGDKGSKKRSEKSYGSAESEVSKQSEKSADDESEFEMLEGTPFVSEEVGTLHNQAFESLEELFASDEYDDMSEMEVVQHVAEAVADLCPATRKIRCTSDSFKVAYGVFKSYGMDSNIHINIDITTTKESDDSSSSGLVDDESSSSTYTEATYDSVVGDDESTSSSYTTTEKQLSFITPDDDLTGSAITFPSDFDEDLLNIIDAAQDSVGLLTESNQEEVLTIFTGLKNQVMSSETENEAYRSATYAVVSVAEGSTKLWTRVAENQSSPLHKMSAANYCYAHNGSVYDEKRRTRFLSSSHTPKKGIRFLQDGTQGVQIDKLRATIRADIGGASRGAASFFFSALQSGEAVMEDQMSMVTTILQIAVSSSAAGFMAARFA